MIVDAHAHVWSGEVATFPHAPIDGVAVPSSPRPVEGLLRELDQVGVDRVVLIQPRSYGYDHAYLTSVLAREPSRVVGVCLVDPLGPDAPSELRRRCKDGYRGLRLIGLEHGEAAWLLDGRTSDLWEAATELGVVVSLLLEPHQLTSVGRVASAYPKLSIAIDHLGRCRPGASELPELLDLAALPNVHLKVSALHWLSGEGPPFANLRPMVAACFAASGASRLLWGTDYPHLIGADRYPAPLEVLSGLLEHASDAELALIAGGNAARLYGLG